MITSRRQPVGISMQPLHLQTQHVAVLSAFYNCSFVWFHQIFLIHFLSGNFFPLVSLHASQQIHTTDDSFVFVLPFLFYASGPFTRWRITMADGPGAAFEAAVTEHEWKLLRPTSPFGGTGKAQAVIHNNDERLHALCWFITDLVECRWNANYEYLLTFHCNLYLYILHGHT